MKRIAILATVLCPGDVQRTPNPSTLRGTSISRVLPGWERCADPRHTGSEALNANVSRKQSRLPGEC